MSIFSIRVHENIYENIVVILEKQKALFVVIFLVSLLLDDLCLCEYTLRSVKNKRKATRTAVTDAVCVCACVFLIKQHNFARCRGF